MEKKEVIIASRNSKLALRQTEIVRDLLQEAHPDIQFKILEFTTKGDKILDVSLNKIGDKGLFTKELEVALLSNDADLAVHSLKDMPTSLPEGLKLAAISKREDSSDALVMNSKNKHLTLETLPAGSMIGTSSLRRVAQLKREFPHLIFKSVRGNLQTRLAKLDNFDDFGYDGIILATAGLTRLGLEDRIHQQIADDICFPAMGQGALAIECRENDVFITNLVSVVNHPETQLRCRSERSFLKSMEGGCQVPIGVLSEIKENQLHLHGRVLNLDGSKCVEFSVFTGDLLPDSVENLGEELARKLKEQGAMEILREVYNKDIN